MELICESTASLTALSPLDGRYVTKVSELRTHFSEWGLIKYRREVEIRYWHKLMTLILKNKVDDLKSVGKICEELIGKYSTVDTLQVKNIERSTKHDVKAVEKHVRQCLADLSVTNLEFVHFALTSHDINSVAMNLQMRGGIQCLSDQLGSVLDTLTSVAIKDWGATPVLARTHGQPATPTVLGKELSVFIIRLECQLELLNSVQLTAKFGGATGNMNAHTVAYPDINWTEFAESFLGQWGFNRSYPTTQIEHFDVWSEVFDIIRRINGIFIDLARDYWMYISYGYFIQKNIESEVGSSTMPHKINPIYFENAEGNLLMANAMLQFFSQQFQLSRMQRDLVNSTLWRNVGVAFGHTLIGWKGILEGFNRIEPNLQFIDSELTNHYEVLSEPLQILLRKYCQPEAYDRVKALFRGTTGMSQTEWLKLVDNLEMDADYPELTEQLRKLTPQSYAKIGI